MRIYITILLTIHLCCSLDAQIDTLALKNEVYSLNNRHQHIKFWDKINKDDQFYRGKRTNDSIDFTNLIKCSYYLNRFGYPSKDELGNHSQIISFVWIHNSYPQTDLLTFPIIMEGFKTNHISEKNFRNYYFRSIYSEKYSDEGYKSLTIAELIKKINPQVNLPIDIKKLVKTYTKEYNFIRLNHETIGVWQAPTSKDTLFLDGKPIVKYYKQDPIKIFKTKEGKYYYHKLFDDNSFYPREVIFNKLDKSFKLNPESKAYLQILNDNRLKVVSENGDYQIYTAKLE